MHTTTGFIKAIAASLAIFAGAALAQPQAGGTVKLLVGFPAGGAPDAVARAFADQLREASGAIVIVENRPGASGKIAIDALRAAAATGETMALIPSSVLALTPLVMKSAQYDSVKDFTALASVGEYGFGIGAGPLSAATTIDAYKTWANTHAEQSNYATPGTGTPQHFLGAQLQKLLGIELTNIPYKGGAPALNDVLGGQVPLLITTEQLLVPYQGNTKINTLFVTSKQRNPKLANVPTAREVGLPELEANDWFGVFMPAGASQDAIAQWRAAMAQVVASAKYQELMGHLGYTVPQQQPADFTQLLAKEKAAWSERVQLSEFVAD